LLTAQPQRLLPTILSRCLRLSFGAGAGHGAAPYRARLLPLLVKFTTADNQGIAAAYRFLAEITAFLQEIRGKIREQIEAEEDAAGYEELEPKVRERLEMQREARIEGEYRAAREQVLEEMYGWFGDLLLCAEKADRQVLEHRDQIDVLRKAVTGLTHQRAEANLNAIEQIRDALARSISEPLALEVGFLKLARS
jgi:DNA polymerase III subunit delta'